MKNELSLGGDWSAVEDAAQREWAEAELARELGSEHVLYGLNVMAVGRRYDRDDFLFRLGDGRYAQVHLTMKSETNPRWPDTRILSTFDEWKAASTADR